MKLWVTDLDNTLCNTDALKSDMSRLHELSLFDGVENLFKALREKNVPIVILSKGDPGYMGDAVYQKSKITHLGLVDKIDDVFIAESDAQKALLFKKILSKYAVEPEEVVMIGDRRDSEVSIGREFGAKTIWFTFGKYNQDNEAPEGVHVAHTYKDVLELLSIL